jgi:hypothetical protein
MPRKFIVLGRPRSGTTMVAAGLAQHPNVRCYLELLNESPALRLDRHWISREGRSIFEPPLYVIPSDRMTYENGEDAAAFLQRTLYARPWPPNIAAVGFKIDHAQARETPMAFRAWPMLIGDRDLVVVRVCRRNLLAAYVSHIKARASGLWHSWHDHPPSPYVTDNLTLVADNCAKYFAAERRWYDWGLDVFREHPHIDVEYESDLTGNYVDTMNRVFAALGLPEHRIEQKTRKLEQRTLASQISNYAALAEEFRGTPWEEFFAA